MRSRAQNGHNIAGLERLRTVVFNVHTGAAEHEHDFREVMPVDRQGPAVHHPVQNVDEWRPVQEGFADADLLNSRGIGHVQYRAIT